MCKAMKLSNKKIITISILVKNKQKIKKKCSNTSKNVLLKN